MMMSTTTRSEKRRPILLSTIAAALKAFKTRLRRVAEQLAPLGYEDASGFHFGAPRRNAKRAKVRHRTAWIILRERRRRRRQATVLLGAPRPSFISPAPDSSPHPLSTKWTNLSGN
jgi:hypothetical protein